MPAEKQQKRCGAGMMIDIISIMAMALTIALIAAIGIQIVAIIVAMGLDAIEMIRSMIYKFYKRIWRYEK